MSHSSEWLAVVLGKNINVGVDIEEFDREMLDFTGIVELGCNADEKMHLFNLPSMALKKKHFLYFWTAKEAFLKMLGLGIGDYLPSICMGSNELITCDGIDGFQGYSLLGKTTLVTTEKYVASIGYSNFNAIVIFHQLKDVASLFE